MKRNKILQRDEPMLRQIAKSVTLKDIKSKKIKSIISKMKKALHAEDDGVAIAAPQIGESLRIFIANGQALARADRAKKLDAGKELKDLVFINPEIIKTSKKKRLMEEGCLSVRWLYGHVKRSEKVTLRAHDENGSKIVRGASGLLAQIFQHETDHLNGILFTDKAENIRDLPPTQEIRFVFFGSSQFSKYVLEELKDMGHTPLLNISSSKDPLPIEALRKIGADVFVVASFGKILPKEIIEMPRRGTLNLHPSLLPKLRGPSPIQNTILGLSEPGVTIIKMDERIDHGPIIAKVKVSLDPWPDHYAKVEEKLARDGARLLGTLLPRWIRGGIKEKPQDENLSSSTRLIKKEDGHLNLKDPARDNQRKVFAYSTWPGAYFFFKNKKDKDVRIVVKDAKIKDEIFTPTRVIPAGKREMDWQDFLRGNA